jgi:hypothetical protein
MNATPSLRHGAAAGALLLALAAAPASAAITLAPQHAGSFADGTGAIASFVQIDSAWRGSTVLWDEASGTFGSGVPVSTYAWGTGLWGRADWQTVQDTAAGNPPASNAPPIVQRWSGPISSINYANALYNDQHSAIWGTAQLVPFFSAGDAAPQENWTFHAAGYIRVTTPGEYAFSVLNDDGFFMRLTGAGGSTLEMGRDYLHPRERIGFGDILLLSEGLYGFDLGMWNRLEAGVVDLRWMTPGSTEWTLVPTSNLVPIPEPGTALLLLAGALPLAWRLRRRA